MPKLEEAPGASVSESAVFQLDPRMALAFYGVLLLIALIPVFSFDVLPLGDMPNHLARAYILDNLGSNADLQKFYTTRWLLFSFQSTDFLLPLLTKLFGLASGAHLYIAGAFLLLVGGTAALHRALFGRVGLWPAAATLFLYGFPLALGQISFLFATGLSLLLFAAWIATEPCRGPARPGPASARLAAFALGSLALFFCHFFAFASYALAIMTYAAARSRSTPGMRQKFLRMFEAGIPFVIPAACFVLAFGASVHGVTKYGDIFAKSLAVLAGTVTYGRWPDIALTVAIIGALWVMARWKLISFSPRMRLTAIVLILAAAAMPRQMTGVLGADLRIPCLLSFLLVAASDIRWRGRRQIVAFAVGVTALLTFRVATISDQWRKFDADYREFRAADVVLERASRVVVIPFRKDFRKQPQPLLPYWFVPAFAVIDRDVFLPNLYTDSTPLRFTPAVATLFGDQPAQSRKVHWRPTSPAFAAANPQTISQVEDVGQWMSTEDLVTSTADWSDWPERFDYAIDLDFSRYQNPVPALLTEIWRGSYFTLYRIHPPSVP